MKIYKPAGSNIRIIKIFALFPISTRYNEEYRWLEVVYVKQCYHYTYGWRNERFVDDNTYREYHTFHRKTKRYW